MSDIGESVLTTVDILVDNKISKLKFDKTIKAEIMSIVDLDIGEYKVKYTGSIFSAYASDINKNYRIGENVYVKVPEGNFSNKKFIERRVSDSKLSTATITDLLNTISIVSPDFKDIYGITEPFGEVGVIAGDRLDNPTAADNPTLVKTENGSVLTIWESTEDSKLFSLYANKYDKLRIKASFKTLFQSLHFGGNYGLRLTFAIDENNTKDYDFDISTFTGNFYNFLIASSLQHIFLIPKGYLKELKKIALFLESFEYDLLLKGYDYNTGDLIFEDNTTINNIFVDNIEIGFVEVKDLSDETLNLDIISKKGTILSSNPSEIELEARLITAGENIMDESTCECLWFIQDYSVYTGADNYDKNAGFGWREIEGQFNKLLIKKSDVVFKNKYKLVVTYNKRTIRTAEIEVTNANSLYDCGLAQETLDEHTVLKIENFNNDNVLIGNWYMSYPDSTYISLAKDKNSIEIDLYLKYSIIYFYCLVFDGSDIVTNLLYQVSVSQDAADLSISFQGLESYRYDANGVIQVIESEKSRFLKSTIAWKNGISNTVTSFKIFGPDKKLLTNESYSPANSLMENIWIDSNNIIMYNIKKKYDVNNSRNTFFFEITAIDGLVYEFLKSITFLKDGNLGVNGSTYMAVIRPCDSNGILEYGYFALKDEHTYCCYVYRDNERINGEEDNGYQITYNWEAFNLDVITNKAEKMIVTGIGNHNIDTGHYLKCTVKIADTLAEDPNDIDTKTIIYVLLPIDIVVGNNIDNSLIDVSALPSEIKYSASGTLPEFVDGNLEFLYNGKNKDFYSTNKLLFDIENFSFDDIIYRRLKPVSRFLGTKESMPAFKCIIDNSNYIIHSVLMYLDTYGNEAINGWDGVGLEVRKEGKDTDYLFAPLIGAGEKNDANQFTGMVMAKGQFDPEDKKNKWGLYGFKSGLNTFGLAEDGRAWFGQEGGLIIVDGEKATITGGGGGDSSNGMTITLASTKSSDKAILIGNNNFWVDYAGNLHASKATITGVINASSGTIGRWKINAKGIESPTGKVILNDNGAITIEEGTIAGWNITETSLLSPLQSNWDEPYITLSATDGIIISGNDLGNKRPILIKTDGTATFYTMDVKGPIYIATDVELYKELGNNKIAYGQITTVLDDDGSLAFSLDTTYLSQNNVSIKLKSNKKISIEAQNAMWIQAFKGHEGSSAISMNSNEFAITAKKILINGKVLADENGGLYAYFGE